MNRYKDSTDNELLDPKARRKENIQTEVEDNSSHGQNGERSLTSQTCNMAGQQVHVCSQHHVTPTEHGSTHETVISGGASDLTDNGKKARGQAAAARTTVPNFDPVGVNNRKLAHNALRNALSARLRVHHWERLHVNDHTPGFRPNSNTKVMLTDYQAGLSGIDKDCLLVDSQELVFNPQEKAPGVGSFDNAPSPLPSVFGSASESESDAEGSDPIEQSLTEAFYPLPPGCFPIESEEYEAQGSGRSINGVFYTTEEMEGIQEQLEVRLPHLNSHTKCAHCGKDPAV